MVEAELDTGRWVLEELATAMRFSLSLPESFLLNGAFEAEVQQIGARNRNRSATNRSARDRCKRVLPQVILNAEGSSAQMGLVWSSVVQCGSHVRLQGWSHFQKTICSILQPAFGFGAQFWRVQAG